MNDFIYMFALIGIIVSVCLLISGIYIIIISINEIIKNQKIKYQYKHKFDKPPKAKCYCKDCIYHEEDYYCGYVKQKTPEDGFCYRAKINE